MAHKLVADGYKNTAIYLYVLPLEPI